jgi:hypothetical protein
MKKLSPKTKDALWTIGAIFGFLIAMAALLSVAGCATTELTYDPKGKTTWKSTTFLKNVKDADVQWGTMHARLGSSLGDYESINAFSGSLLQNVADTGMITMSGGNLVDTLGRPRSATAAEMAAQYKLLERLNN